MIFFCLDTFFELISRAFTAMVITSPCFINTHEQACSRLRVVAPSHTMPTKDHLRKAIPSECLVKRMTNRNIWLFDNREHLEAFLKNAPNPAIHTSYLTPDADVAITQSSDIIKGDYARLKRAFKAQRGMKRIAAEHVTTVPSRHHPHSRAQITALWPGWPSSEFASSTIALSSGRTNKGLRWTSLKKNTQTYAPGVISQKPAIKPSRKKAEGLQLALGYKISENNVHCVLLDSIISL